MCICVNHSRSVVPQQETKIQNLKTKHKILYNGIFSFDISKDVPPLIIRIMNSQVLIKNTCKKNQGATYSRNITAIFHIV